MFADVRFSATELISIRDIEFALMFVLFSRTLLNFILTLGNHGNCHSGLKTN